MNKKRTKIIILLLIILLIAVGIVVTVCLLGKQDKDTAKGDGTTENVAVATTADASPEKPATSIEETTEVTTETAASTEKPSEEEPTTEAPATEGTTSAPAKPENSGSVKPETTEAPAPSAPQETTEAPATTEEPKHEHSWVWVETKAAWTETVVVSEAWTETIEHPAQYDEIPAVQCKYCGEKFTTADAFWAHKDAYWGIDDQHACGGSRDAWIQVLVKEAWTETINHPAETKTVDHPAEGYYKCNCGATK